MKKTNISQTAGSLKNFILKEKQGIPFSEVLAKTKELVAKDLTKK